MRRIQKIDQYKSSQTYIKEFTHKPDIYQLIKNQHFLNLLTKQMSYA